MVLWYLRAMGTIPRQDRYPPSSTSSGDPILTNVDLQQSPVKPGDVLAGKYRVEKILGAGGMGVVVCAHHMQLDEKVAIKFLLPDALANKDAVERFGREARAAVKIKSEHVARVIDVGELASGAPYIVMEYLEGQDLAQWLESNGVLPVAQAVEFILQACEALAQAHGLGIVHRDLKPANLFCVRTPDGALAVKVLDFGISKLTGGDAPAHDMTRTSSIFGSPQYMSPEQLMSSKNVDARADLWALGVILFELLTGRAPFAAESISELSIRIASYPAPRLREVYPGATLEIESAIAKCLEKDRELRFRDVGELAAALAAGGSAKALASADKIDATLQRRSRALSIPDANAVAAVNGVDAAVPTQGIDSGSLPAARGKTGDVWARTGGSQHHSRWRAYAAVALIVGLGAFWAWRSLRSDRFVAASPPSTLVTAAQPGASADAAGLKPESLVTLPSAGSISVDELPRAEVVPPPVAPTAAAPARTPFAAAPRATPKVAVAPAPPAPAATVAAPPAAAKVSCDPPYYFAANGTRVFKRECL